jgi:hypothetical protein
VVFGKIAQSKNLTGFSEGKNSKMSGLSEPGILSFKGEIILTLFSRLLSHTRF